MPVSGCLIVCLPDSIETFLSRSNIYVASGQKCLLIAIPHVIPGLPESVCCAGDHTRSLNFNVGARPIKSLTLSGVVTSTRKVTGSPGLYGVGQFFADMSLIDSGLDQGAGVSWRHIARRKTSQAGFHGCCNHFFTQQFRDFATGCFVASHKDCRGHPSNRRLRPEYRFRQRVSR